jgi:hypothetical protein
MGSLSIVTPTGDCAWQKLTLKRGGRAAFFNTSSNAKIRASLVSVAGKSER